MRMLALAALTILITRSVLDPNAGITLIQGLLLLGVGWIAVNWMIPKRGMSVTSLVFTYLIVRGRKEKHHASQPEQLHSVRREARKTRHQADRKAA